MTQQLTRAAALVFVFGLILPAFTGYAMGLVSFKLAVVTLLTVLAIARVVGVTE